MSKRFRGRRRFKRRKFAFTKRQNAVIKKMVHGEADQKYVQLANIVETPYTSSSTIELLTGVVNGPDENERIGNDIMVHSCQIRLNVVGSTGNSAASPICRWMLVLVRDTNQTDPDLAEILDSDGVDQLRDINHLGDFKIIRDKQFVLQSSGTASIQESYFIDKYIQFKKPIKSTFVGTSGLVADTGRNHLFLILMCNKGNTTQPEWTGNIRIRYTDM